MRPILPTLGTVSLLTNFESAADLDDWEIGVHGVWIDFVDMQNKSRNAVYLPDVIPEQGAPPAVTAQVLSLAARALTADPPPRNRMDEG